LLFFTITIGAVTRKGCCRIQKAQRDTVPFSGIVSSGEGHDVPNTPHTGIGASQHGVTTVWCDPAAAGSASVNVSGQGTPQHREVRGRPSCGGRASGKKNRSGNSSTCSKAREGFPVIVGALKDRAASWPHRSRMSERRSKLGHQTPRGQMSRTAKGREGVSRYFHVRPAEIGSPLADRNATGCESSRQVAPSSLLREHLSLDSKRV